MRDDSIDRLCHISQAFENYVSYIYILYMFMLACYFLCALRRRGLIQGKGTTILLLLAMRINMSCTTTTTLFAAYNSMPYFML